MIRVGSFVRHVEDDLGIGRVVAVQRGLNVVLVVWHQGVRRHDLCAVNLIKAT